MSGHGRRGKGLLTSHHINTQTYSSPSVAAVISSTTFIGNKIPPFFWTTTMFIVTPPGSVRGHSKWWARATNRWSMATISLPWIPGEKKHGIIALFSNAQALKFRTQLVWQLHFSRCHQSQSWQQPVTLDKQKQTRWIQICQSQPMDTTIRPVDFLKGLLRRLAEAKNIKLWSRLEFYSLNVIENGNNMDCHLPFLIVKKNHR